jgi:hypothetical protein
MLMIVKSMSTRGREEEEDTSVILWADEAPGGALRARVVLDDDKRDRT